MWATTACRWCSGFSVLKCMQNLQKDSYCTDTGMKDIAWWLLFVSSKEHKSFCHAITSSIHNCCSHSHKLCLSTYHWIRLHLYVTVLATQGIPLLSTARSTLFFKMVQEIISEIITIHLYLQMLYNTSEDFCCPQSIFDIFWSLITKIKHFIITTKNCHKLWQVVFCTKQLQNWFFFLLHWNEC